MRNQKATTLARNPEHGAGRSLRRRVLFASALAASILGACAAPQAATLAGGQSPMEISRATNTALLKYFDLIEHTRRGAFAVSLDGKNSYSYYCPEITCQSNFFTDVALTQCRSLSGQDCIVLYVARDPRLAYSVNTAEGLDGRHGLRRGKPLSEISAFDR